jgi:hypothetical protein
LGRVVPFDPDEFVDRIPRDELLKPIPVDFALQQDKYWRSFGVPKNELDGSTSRSLAWILLATCLLVRNDPTLAPAQFLVLGHNIGALRMMMRMYADQRTLISQASHADDYLAERRALQLFSILEQKHRGMPLKSDKSNTPFLAELVAAKLKDEGFKRVLTKNGVKTTTHYGIDTVLDWRRRNTPKTERRLGRRRKT